MEKEITIFICESRDVSREIIGKYLEAGKVTYAEMLPVRNREKIVEFLKSIEEDFLTLP